MDQPPEAGRAAVSGGVLAGMRNAVAIARDRRRAQRVLRGELRLRPGQGLQDLVDAIARERDRDITVAYLPLPTQVSGFCCRGARRDIIIVDRDASELHRLLITGHELWHLLEADPPDPCSADEHRPLDADALAGLLPTLPKDLVREVMSRPVRMRSHYTPAQERAAEVFATVLLQMLPLHTDAGGTGAITSSLEHRRTGI